MLLQGKKILIMGIRNKWSIAWGAAVSAYEQGAQIIFTYNSETNKPKVEKPKEYQYVEGLLRKKYRTRIKVDDKSITIKYSDTDDLNRLLELMGVIEES